MKIAAIIGALIAAALLIWDPAVGLPVSVLLVTAAICSRNRHPLRGAGFALFLVVVSALLLEALLLAVRHSPPVAALPPLRELARGLYMLDRNMIQAVPEASIYHPRLGYTLRPGRFAFANTEFLTTYNVNSLGIRDDEAALDKPRIVVIGDSFAMGWGVEGDETFASVLEGISGLKVLNTAVSSYGTARELRFLEQIDLGSATHLVIQFCNNDFFENSTFFNDGPDFEVQSADTYAAMLRNHRAGRRYYPGRYAATVVGGLLTKSRALSPLRHPVVDDRRHPDPDDIDNQRAQVRYFLHVLQHAPVDISHLAITVFELNAYNRFRQYFTPLLREALQDPSLPSNIRTMRVLALADELGPEHWFVLDDHIRASGHRLVAERLWQEIEGDFESK